MLKLIGILMFCTSMAFAADVSGTWQFTVKTSQGTGSPTVVLQQKGEQIMGTFTSPVLGESKLTGWVKADNIDFAFQAGIAGLTMKISYKGTVDSPTTMKGTAVYAGFDDKVTWSATKR